MEFWQKRDPDPSTPGNEFREEFYGRLQYANERYAVRSMEGWETDRGRTVIKFGSPSAIEPHLYDRGFKPYEVWQYNNIPGEGQAIFVFADRDGFGEFEMIHSTVAGERKLANWQEELRDGYSN
jgi:GWxTD domain-containing protein